MVRNDVVLQTEKVLLRPIETGDYAPFLQLTREDRDMWEYFSSRLSDADQLKNWLDSALQEKAAGTRMPFTIIEKVTGQIAGSSSIGNISWHDKRLEIGWSWLAAQFRSTGINRHAKFCMMRHASEEMNFERVEFKTGVLNTRARKGL
ncbi:GNAT family N-acetyltransferase [Niabella aquatica]